MKIEFFVPDNGHQNCLDKSLIYISAPRKGWVTLTIAFPGKFVYIAHRFILLHLNPFDLSGDREGCWFEICVIVASLLVSSGC